MQPITIGMYIRGFAMGGPTPPPLGPVEDGLILAEDGVTFMITEDGDNMIKE
jgi:hypothetical protein